MKLIRFRVTGFRSVVDSGWIEISDITALIGENEVGKTNLLLPLWKLNPADPSNGEIDPLSDMPRSLYHEMRNKKPSPVFIEAEFELDDSLAASVAKIAQAQRVEQVRLTRIGRSYDGSYTVTFPEGVGVNAVGVAELNTLIEDLKGELVALTLDNAVQEEAKNRLIVAIDQQKVAIATKEISIATVDIIRETCLVISSAIGEVVAVSSSLGQIQKSIDSRFERLVKKTNPRHPDSFQAACNLIKTAIPNFVYYSNYGNLDSEIYLPHVIENLNRLKSREITGSAAAKARTLKVLFDFVRVSAQEIRNLGHDPHLSHLPNTPSPTEAQIADVARKKKEREVLLSSASTQLSRQFKEWWKRGEYVFRFQADGDYFRIWVRDALRPEEIELEGRSSGLQWFFSFFIVFLSERGDEHRNAILLLDEPGVSLHPLAQEDLFRFFESLAVSNQLLYTAHSSHLINPDRLSDVKVVYVNDLGATTVSADLRASEKDPRRSQSIFAVDAALGLSVSRTMLFYAYTTIVEGPSDQIYFSFIKSELIGKAKITPMRELIFIPAGGARAVSATARIVGAPGVLPPVILDGDTVGRQAEKALSTELYAESTDYLLMIDDFTGSIASEVEDLMPRDVMVEVASRLFQSPNALFSDEHDDTKPIVPQIKGFADHHGIELKHGWKVNLARQVTRRLERVRNQNSHAPLPETWDAIFQRLLTLFKAGQDKCAR
jgi:hypothetical protein